MKPARVIAIVVLLAAALATAFAAPVQYKLSLNAPWLKPRVADLMDRFEEYRAGGVALPVYTLIYNSHMSPADTTVLKRVATRADGHPRTVEFSADKSKLTSDGNAVSGAGFDFGFLGQVSTLGVDVPDHVECKLETKVASGTLSSVKFAFDKGIAFHLQNIKLPLKVDRTLFLLSVLVTRTYVTYEIGDAAASPKVVYLLTLKLGDK